MSEHTFERPLRKRQKTTETETKMKTISLEELHSKSAFICDMDGVIYHGNTLLPDVREFVKWLVDNDKQFLFLTNSSERSRKELSLKLKRMGLSVPEDHFYTSALATAPFRTRFTACSIFS